MPITYLTNIVLWKHLYFVVFILSDGRVMVDGSSFRRMNLDYKHEDYAGSNSSSSNQNNALETVDDESLFRYLLFFFYRSRLLFISFYVAYS
jgi:hypothetical protein